MSFIDAFIYFCIALVSFLLGYNLRMRNYEALLLDREIQLSRLQESYHKIAQPDYDIPIPGMPSRFK